MFFSLLYNVMHSIYIPSSRAFCQTHKFETFTPVTKTSQRRPHHKGTIEKAELPNLQPKTWTSSQSNITRAKSLGEVLERMPSLHPPTHLFILTILSLTIIPPTNSFRTSYYIMYIIHLINLSPIWTATPDTAVQAKHTPPLSFSLSLSLTHTHTHVHC